MHRMIYPQKNIVRKKVEKLLCFKFIFKSVEFGKSFLANIIARLTQSNSFCVAFAEIDFV